jgi:hypothetical protein
MKDSSLVNSSLLSAATDNAKELILAKINANPDLMKVYLYGIIVGIDFNDIAALMTSPTVNAITKLSESNVFNTLVSNMTLDKALTSIRKGIDLDNLIPKEWRFAIDGEPEANEDITVIRLLRMFTIPDYIAEDEKNSSNFLPSELAGAFEG